MNAPAADATYTVRAYRYILGLTRFDRRWVFRNPDVAIAINCDTPYLRGIPYAPAASLP